MQYLQMIADWAASTWWAGFMIDHRWPLFPIGETLHFIGLAFIVGGIAMLDLRMLGVAKMLPIGPLHKLIIPWAIFGFVLNLSTGLFLFFFTMPSTYITTLPFVLKMLFIFFAGVNVWLFYLTTSRETLALGPGEDAPQPAKMIAAASLFLWAMIIFCGRLTGV